MSVGPWPEGGLDRPHCSTPLRAGTAHTACSYRQLAANSTDRNTRTHGIEVHCSWSRSVRFGCARGSVLQCQCVCVGYARTRLLSRSRPAGQRRTGVHTYTSAVGVSNFNQGRCVNRSTGTLVPCPPICKRHPLSDDQPARDDSTVTWSLSLGCCTLPNTRFSCVGRTCCFSVARKSVTP